MTSRKRSSSSTRARNRSGSRKRSNTISAPRPSEIVTVGDDVQLNKDLHGIVRFVGEIVQRSGIYYGIELNEARGKNNGTLSNIRYFKCKIKRGLFLRRSRIQHVLHSKRNLHKETVYRIGIHQCVQLNINAQRVIGNIRYIGSPTKCNGIYYGIELVQSVGDTNGTFHGIRYFTTDKNCAYFMKANSKRITYPVQVQTSSVKENGNKKQKAPKKRRYSTDTDSNDSSGSTDTDSDESSESKDDELRLMECHKYYKNREKQLYQNEALQRHLTENHNNTMYDRKPLKLVGNEWMLSAQNADTFKKRYECTRSLMEKVCGNSNKIPYTLNFGGDAINILRLFADWLHIEQHIVVRKHILQLLVPIGNTAYPVSVWKGASTEIAESLITTQWFDNKRGFVPLVRPALIAVYIGSYSQIKEWQPWLLKAILSDNTNAQIQCWDFLTQLLEISVMRKALLWIYEDLMSLMEDGTFMDMIRNVLMKNKDNRVRLKCCLFVYGIVSCFRENQDIQNIYTILAEDHGLKIYFDSISQSKYSAMFKPMLHVNQVSYNSPKQRRVYGKVKMQRLEPSISAPAQVSEDSGREMLMDEHKQRRKRMDETSSSSSSEEEDGDDDEEEVMAMEDDSTDEEKEESDIKKDMVSKIEEKDEEKKEIKEIKEEELCANCVKKKDRLEELNMELNNMYDEIKGLNVIISDLKIEKNEYKKDKDVWMMNVEQSMKKYRIKLQSKKAMEQQLFELRKTLYELKKLDQENEDILDPKHLNQWSSRNILEWIIALDHGNYLKFENNLRRLLQERNINGKALINGDLNETDLRNCGIHRFRDRKQLIKHIYGLVEQYKELRREYEEEKQEMERDNKNLIVPQEMEDDDDQRSDLSSQKEPGNGSVLSSSILSEQLEGRIKEEEEEKKEILHPEPGSEHSVDEDIEQKSVEIKKDDDDDDNDDDNKEIKRKSEVMEDIKEENVQDVAHEDSDGFECNQCFHMKKEDEGYEDEDGIWYCLQCWDDFDAELEPDDPSVDEVDANDVSEEKKKEEEQKVMIQEQEQEKSVLDAHDVDKLEDMKSVEDDSTSINTDESMKSVDQSIENKDDDHDIAHSDKMQNGVESENGHHNSTESEDSGHSSIGKHRLNDGHHLNISANLALGSPEQIHMAMSPQAKDQGDFDDIAL